MNPRIAMSYAETGDWLVAFVRSHAKREDPRIEASLEMGDAREGRSHGIRLTLGGRSIPPPGQPPVELELRDVLEGRPRFAWCEALGARIRALARELRDTRAAA